MERKARGIKKDGSLFDSLFETPPGVNETIKSEAELSDTIAMLPEKVDQYHFQARRIAAALQDIDGNVRKTCYNIWRFLTEYIAYKPDQKGKEQVRSVWRLWRDKLGDCDCFSFFTSCVLKVLNIPHLFRITSYEKGTGGFQHVYIVVPNNGKEITVDAVLPEFDREYPYKDKIEIQQEMELQFLNGLDPEEIARNGGISIDAEDLLSSQLPSRDGSVGSLKTFVQKAKDKVQNVVQNVKQDVKQAGQKIKTAAQNVKQDVKQAVKKAGTVVKKAVHVVNRVNPVTTALRLGLLAGMKLNIFGVAGQLRYAYLPDSEASRRGLNMKRFERFKKVRVKLEKIFFNAGGKPENLKEAILTGKGNQDKAIGLSGYPLSGLGITSAHSVQQIIGSAMFTDETPQEATMNGLGEVATATVVTAASGILAAIAGILKNIGLLTEKGEPGSDKGLEELDQQAGGDGAANEEMPTDEYDFSGERESSDSTYTDSDSTDTGTESTESSGGSAGSGSSGTGSGDAPPPTSGFDLKAWATKYKTPLLIAGAGAVVIAGVVFYRKFVKKSGKGEGRRAETTNGVPRGARGSKKQLKGGLGKNNDHLLRKLRLSRMQ